MAGARAPIAAGYRLLGRVFDALQWVERRQPAGLVLPAAAAANDVRLLAKLRDARWWPGWADWLFDALHSGIRAAVADGDPIELAPTLASNIIPSTVLSSYQHTAGTDSVPVTDAAREWPPDDARSWVATAAGVAAPTALSLGATQIVRRLRRQPAAGREVLLIGLGAALVGTVAARYRDRLQRQSRELWADRAAAQIQTERASARVNARTAATPGHEFAKVLVALGTLGSAEAAAAGRAAMEEPHRLLNERHDGVVLRSVIGSLPVEPPDAARLWVPRDQVAELQAQMSRAAETAADGEDQRVHVVRVTGSETVLLWLGQEISVRAERLPFTARLSPTLPSLVIAAHHKLWPMIDGVPLSAVLPGALADLASAARFRRPPTDGELRALLAVVSLATVAGHIGVGRASVPLTNGHGRRHTHQTAISLGALVVLSTHWSRLTSLQRCLAPAVLVGWAAGIRRQGPLPWTRWVSDLCVLLMPAVSSFKLTERVDEEATVLQQTLLQDFDRDAQRARIDAELELLDDYDANLGLARRALGGLDTEVPPSLEASIVQDCDRLELWIAEQRSRLSDDDR